MQEYQLKKVQEQSKIYQNDLIES